jgi:hypothetical protein
MSEKGRHPKVPREERLAEQLRANLRRRKQAARKTKEVSPLDGTDTDHNSNKSSP